MGGYLGTKKINVKKTTTIPHYCGTSLFGEDKNEDQRRKKFAKRFSTCDRKRLHKMIQRSLGKMKTRHFNMLNFNMEPERQPENLNPSSS